MKLNTKQNLVAILVIIALSVISLLGIYLGKNADAFTPTAKSKHTGFFLTFKDVSTSITDTDGNGHPIQLNVSIELAEDSELYDEGTVLNAIETALSDMDYDKVISPEHSIRYINDEVQQGLKDLYPDGQILSVSSYNLQSGDYRFPADESTENQNDVLKSLFPNVN